ncbi:Fibrous sheath-interacting protein 1 [Acipenser ruthenus]|uniref:Fibrous sheath-interacting protein 1 n=1 Tax=Acipenser ruthenus TaxID=7906 RepID=A0A444UKP3_ACIRT|nr:Fibrous sheath-interacting protein 1 [Acipenser ruthenus]
MDILKGSLEEISRPASSARSRPGSRASNMLVQDRLRVSVACSGSLEVLTAESGGSQDRSSDLEDLLCPPGSSADFSGDELSCESEGANPISTQKTEPPKRQLHLLSEEKVSCILQGVQNPSSNTGSSKPDGSDEENKDPRLQEAIQKMKKLDKILASKVSREREIKKQGKELRIQLWEELQSTKHEGLSESHDELENTRRFLSLTPTYGKQALQNKKYEQCFQLTLAKDAGNAVLMTDDEKRRLAELLKDIGEDGSTSLPSDEPPMDIGTRHKCSIIGTLLLGGPRLAGWLAGRTFQGNPSQWAVSLTPGEGYTPEPSELHHLTEIDSKLQALLSAEDYSALHSPYSSCRQLQGNPSQWAVSLTPGEGYTPEPSELHHLTEIDSKLQALLSAEDYSALHSPYSSCRQLQGNMTIPQ